MTLQNQRPDWKPPFLEAFGKTGNVSEAAKVAGISRNCAYQHYHSDEAFRAEWDSAEETSHDTLEREAFRRAYEGVDDFKVGAKGELVPVRKYSDVLLIFLLKARRPERYRDNATVRHTGPDGGALVVEHKGRLTLADVAELALQLRPDTSIGGVVPPPRELLPAPRQD